MSHFEWVRARPGCLDEYHERLLGEYAPIVAERGTTPIGFFRDVVDSDLGLNIWALPDWRSIPIPLSSADPKLQSWLMASDEMVLDVWGFYVAPPPTQRLRT